MTPTTLELPRNVEVLPYGRTLWAGHEVAEVVIVRRATQEGLKPVTFQVELQLTAYLDGTVRVYRYESAGRATVRQVSEAEAIDTLRAYLGKGSGCRIECHVVAGRVPLAQRPSTTGQDLVPGMEVLGECQCGGQVRMGPCEVTVEAGGEMVTRTETDIGCTGCGGAWQLKEG